MIDYLLRFANESAARTALSKYVVATSWRKDCVLPGQSVMVRGARMSGFCVLVSAKELLPDLLTSPAFLAAFDRCDVAQSKAGAILKSNISPPALQTLTLSPVFAGSEYEYLAQLVSHTNLVFSDDFDDGSSIDMTASGAQGFRWYPQGWFGGATTPEGSIQLANSILTLTGSLHSAIASTSGFVGSVFGSGAYFEARIAFNPALGANAAGAWPAFWSMAIEHITGNDQWPGQESGYAHFIELDFFEAWHSPNESYVGKTAYFGTAHDWSGVYNSKYPFNIQNSGNNSFNVGPVDWSEFHRYGCLWEPTSSGAPGRATWFFDDLAGPTIYWSGSDGAPPLSGQGAGSLTPSSPESAADTYSVIDRQRLALSLSTDPNWPMMVDWVRVWQTS